jgi:uncharacterized protein YfaP (DUF2135 family)
MKKYRAKNNRSFMNHSHLRKHLEKQSVRNLLMGIGGSIAIIILAFTFGPDLLINLSSMHVKKDSQTITTQESNNNVNYIEPPTLDDPVEATNSASITIQGSSLPKQTIKLYINGKFIDKTNVKSDGNFSFPDISLEKGANEFTAKAEENNKQSNYSSPVQVKYIDKAPDLEISNPQDGQTFAKGNNSIKVSGKTNSDAEVTVNGARAITNSDGSFSYLLTIHDGDNNIKFVSTDDAGNKAEKEIKIKVE